MNDGLDLTENLRYLCCFFANAEIALNFGEPGGLQVIKIRVDARAVESLESPLVSGSSLRAVACSV